MRRIALLLFASLTFISCTEDVEEEVNKDLECFELMKTVGNAAHAYSENPTPVYCKLYKEALQAAIQAQCNASTLTEQLAQLQCD